MSFILLSPSSKTGSLRGTFSTCLNLSVLGSWCRAAYRHYQEARPRMENLVNYNQWPHEKLVERINQLEQELEKGSLRLQPAVSFMKFF